MYHCILMDYLVYALDPYSHFEDLCPLALRSVGDREDGSSTWGLSSIEGKKWKMNTSAESEAPRMVGRAHSESFRWLPFSIFRLWGCKVGQSVSPLQKRVIFLLLPGQSPQSRLLVGWKENNLRWELFFSFRCFLLAHFLATQMARCVCVSTLLKQGSFPT